MYIKYFESFDSKLYKEVDSHGSSKGKSIRPDISEIKEIANLVGRYQVILNGFECPFVTKDYVTTIQINVSEIFNNNTYTYATILKYSDDWFLIRYGAKAQSKCRGKYFECDQIDGLIQNIKDMLLS